MSGKIRFIIDENRPADFNMAADLHLLEHCKGKDTVFVRFYSWKRPSITIGYMQKASELLDLETIRNRNAQWIRRPTGGRAVLHEEDITYSCVFSKHLQWMGTSIAHTYRIITECLMEGLRRASIICDAHDSYDDLREVKRNVKLPCFLAPNRDEIMVNKRKLVGSAQKRVLGAVLQHGSIPLTKAYTRLPEYLNIQEEEKRSQTRLLRLKGTSIREWAPEASFEFMAEKLMEGFSSKLPMPTLNSPWSTDEKNSINRLAQSADFRRKWKSIDSTDRLINTSEQVQ
ncbi:MAG: biotin/lipoate A/B protein ligase family protein [Chitinispirillaceae bacterium]